MLHEGTHGLSIEIILPLSKYLSLNKSIYTPLYICIIYVGMLHPQCYKFIRTKNY